MSTQVGFILSENRLKVISQTEVKLKDRSEQGMFRGLRIEFLFESRELVFKGQYSF